MNLVCEFNTVANFNALPYRFLVIQTETPYDEIRFLLNLRFYLVLIDWIYRYYNPSKHILYIEISEFYILFVFIHIFRVIYIFCGHLYHLMSFRSFVIIYIFYSSLDLLM